jgi:hypothetical protein
MLLGPWWIV